MSAGVKRERWGLCLEMTMRLRSRNMFFLVGADVKLVDRAGLIGNRMKVLAPTSHHYEANDGSQTEDTK